MNSQTVTGNDGTELVMKDLFDTYKRITFTSNLTQQNKKTNTAAT